MSYPGDHLCLPAENFDIAAEYIRAVNAGAKITHTNGIYALGSEIKSDDRKLSRTNFEDGKLCKGRLRLAVIQ